MNSWLPDPGDFRAAFRAARQNADPEGLYRGLVALAGHDLDYLQTLQVDRAAAGIDGAQVAQQPVRIAVLAATTADHLLPAIRVALLRRGILTKLFLTRYGQYRQQLLDPQSELHLFAPECVLFAPSARDSLAATPITASPDEVADNVRASVDELVSFWELMRRRHRCTAIQQSFLNTGAAVFGSFDRLFHAAPSRLLRDLNVALADAAIRSGVQLLDMERALEMHGLGVWFDVGKWLQAKIEIAPAAAPLYGELVARVVSAQRGHSRKCLVLDLDNTLWGGVVGDDGIEQLAIGEGSALGEAYVAFQRYVKTLSERGIILAVCSKNELSTAEAVFDEHPEMVLRRNDFAAFVANWNDKAANLRQIAEQLNIGIDSLVFVDDNPAERARIRQSLPTVAVPELPEDPAMYVTRLAEAGYFEAVSFTADDAVRNRQYAANTTRRLLEASSESLDDYLASLEMTATAGPFADVDLQRVSQLVNKTNQFNVTTRRRSLEEIRAISADPANQTLQVRLADRFGDNGLVSVVILTPVDGQDDVLDIDTWVMSCRVFGRQLEDEIMNMVADMAAGRGTSRILATFVPTPKNGVIRDLYPRLGFGPATRAADEDTCWELDLGTYARRSTHIDVRSET